VVLAADDERDVDAPTLFVRHAFLVRRLSS
jgi:hypothetical protein